MGNGFWILVSDGYGVGLNLINPRLHHDENGNNWWAAETEKDLERKISEMKIIEKYGDNWRVVGWMKIVDTCGQVIGREG